MSTLLTLALMIGFAHADEPIWAGIPLDSLSQMGIDAPTLNHLDSGWRAPIRDGGFVQVNIFETEVAALEAFRFQSMAAASTQLSQLYADIGGGDEVTAVGDGERFVLFLDRNVLVTIRDDNGEATIRAGQLRAALAGPDVAYDLTPVDEQVVDGQRVTWDNYGRRTVSPASE